jgi:hypothetical protein
VEVCQLDQYNFGGALQNFDIAEHINAMPLMTPPVVPEIVRLHEACPSIPRLGVVKQKSDFHVSDLCK